MKHYIYFYYGFPSVREEKMRLIKKYKFDGVFLFWDKYFHKNVGAVKQANLDIETVHLPFNHCNELWVEGQAGDDYVEETIKAIESIAIVEIPTVIFHISSGNNPPMYNELGLSRLRKILSVCEKCNINLALENLRRLDYLDYIYENIESEYLKFCFDSGHANAFTRNIESFPWNKYRDKLICVHLHDNNGLADQHLIPFSGNINWELLALNFKKVNYKGPLTAEAVNPNSALEDEEEYIKKIKKALEQIDRYIA